MKKLGIGIAVGLGELINREINKTLTIKNLHKTPEKIIDISPAINDPAKYKCKVILDGGVITVEQTLTGLEIDKMKKEFKSKGEIVNIKVIHKI